MWGKRHSRYKTPDGGPPMISVRRSSLCYPLVAFPSSKDTLFGACTLLQQRVGYEGMVQWAFSAQLTQWLGALPFVVEAMLWTTVAMLMVFVMYLLERRWL
jgi:hypothetical protein